MEGDLEIASVGDGSVVERASASQDTRVIATARRLSGRTTDDMTEIEIEETHFVKGTTDVVYRGRVTFRCKADQPFCQPMRVTPEFGARPRDVLWRCRPGWMPGPSPREVVFEGSPAPTSITVTGRQVRKNDAGPKGSCSCGGSRTRFPPTGLDEVVSSRYRLAFMPGRGTAT